MWRSLARGCRLSTIDNAAAKRQLGATRLWGVVHENRLLRAPRMLDVAGHRFTGPKESQAVSSEEVAAFMLAFDHRRGNAGTEQRPQHRRFGAHDRTQLPFFFSSRRRHTRS